MSSTSSSSSSPSTRGLPANAVPYDQIRIIKVINRAKFTMNVQMQNDGRRWTVNWSRDGKFDLNSTVNLTKPCKLDPN